MPRIPTTLKRAIFPKIIRYVTEYVCRVYRPPEANADELQIYQPTTDVYSFAIILIEIGGRTEISPPVSQKVTGSACFNNPLIA